MDGLLDGRITRWEGWHQACYYYLVNHLSSSSFTCSYRFKKALVLSYPVLSIGRRQFFKMADRLITCPMGWMDGCVVWINGCGLLFLIFSVLLFSFTFFLHFSLFLLYFSPNKFLFLFWSFFIFFYRFSFLSPSPFRSLMTWNPLTLSWSIMLMCTLPTCNTGEDIYSSWSFVWRL